MSNEQMVKPSERPLEGLALMGFTATREVAAQRRGADSPLSVTPGQ